MNFYSSFQPELLNQKDMRWLLCTYNVSPGRIIENQLVSFVLVNMPSTIFYPIYSERPRRSFPLCRSF